MAQCKYCYQDLETPNVETCPNCSDAIYQLTEVGISSEIAGIAFRTLLRIGYGKPTEKEIEHKHRGIIIVGHKSGSWGISGGMVRSLAQPHQPHQPDSMDPGIHGMPLEHTILIGGFGTDLLGIMERAELFHPDFRDYELEAPTLHISPQTTETLKAASNKLIEIGQKFEELHFSKIDFEVPQPKEIYPHKLQERKYMPNKTYKNKKRK